MSNGDIYKLRDVRACPLPYHSYDNYRHLYNQLIFELYGVPSVGYGIDSLFSLHYNIPDIKDALVLSLGRLFELQSKNNSENL